MSFIERRSPILLSILAALVTLGMACGMLMCVQSHRKLVQM